MKQHHKNHFQQLKKRHGHRVSTMPHQGIIRHWPFDCANGPVPAVRSALTLVCSAIFDAYDCCDAFYLEFVYTAYFDISDVLHVAGTTIRKSRWIQVLNQG